MVFENEAPTWTITLEEGEISDRLSRVYTYKQAAKIEAAVRHAAKKFRPGETGQLTVSHGYGGNRDKHDLDVGAYIYRADPHARIRVELVRDGEEIHTYEIDENMVERALGAAHV